VYRTNLSAVLDAFLFLLSLLHSNYINLFYMYFAKLNGDGDDKDYSDVMLGLLTIG